MDLKNLFYRNGEFSFIKTCCLCCILIFVLFIIFAGITPDTDVNDSGAKEQLTAYDRMPNEFKNTGEYQIVELENSIFAVEAELCVVLNDTHEKTFNNSYWRGYGPNGIELSIKELDDDSSDINPADLKEPNYRDVESGGFSVGKTHIDKVSFTYTHGGDPTNENWIYPNIYTFDKNGKHYQITYYDIWHDKDDEVVKIVESFTKK